MKTLKDFLFSSSLSLLISLLLLLLLLSAFFIINVERARWEGEREGRGFFGVSGHN